MKSTTENTDAVGGTPPATPPAKRKRAKSAAPHAPRTLDPGIAELRKHHSDAGGAR